MYVEKIYVQFLLCKKTKRSTLKPHHLLTYTTASYYGKIALKPYQLAVHTFNRSRLRVYLDERISFVS